MVSPKAVAVAGLSAIAIAAGGCGGDSDPDAEFRAAFEERFGETPWYQHITGMEVDGWLKITTDVDSNSGSRGGVPCGVVFRFALDHGVNDGVELIASDGVSLGGCG